MTSQSDQRQGLSALSDAQMLERASAGIRLRTLDAVSPAAFNPAPAVPAAEASKRLPQPAHRSPATVGR